MYEQNQVNGLMHSLSNKPKTNRSKGSAQQQTDWYHSMAKAWGNALDNQAQKLVDTANSIGEDSTVGDALMVSAQAHQLSFMSNAASTTSNSVGQALETLAKKQ